MTTLNTVGRFSIIRIFSRNLHLSQCLSGMDSREKRLGHLKKTDTVSGEQGAVAACHAAYELIGENLMDRVFGHMKFKDVPVIQISCTRNNTKISVADGQGLVSCLKSAGTEGFKNCRKGTTVAAQAVANRVVTYCKDHEISMARLVFNGLGPGRDSAYKVIELSGIKIISLSDRTEAIEPWVQRPRKAKRI